jgi:uracil-DNA glycosylase
MVETVKKEVQIHPSWKKHLQTQFEQPYFAAIKNHLQQERQQNNLVFPAGKDIFNAFDLTPLDATKVVILGQDPYHNTGQAHGLSFSVPHGADVPPSLSNIIKEIRTDIGNTQLTDGNLQSWAAQGVLLLNSILTVRAHHAASHQKIGWQTFTDAVIQVVSEHTEDTVFMLWGKFAQSKIALIDEKKHLILQAAHPSPLSAHNGFLGCKHFSKANKYLQKNYKTPIDW